jgi:hypothetical protein
MTDEFDAISIWIEDEAGEIMGVDMRQKGRRAVCAASAPDGRRMAQLHLLPRAAVEGVMQGPVRGHAWLDPEILGAGVTKTQ